MNKTISIFVLACLTTFSLFSLMAYIVKNDTIIIDTPEPPVVIEVAERPDDPKPPIERELPQPPAMPEPKPVVFEDIEIVSTGTEITITPPTIVIEDTGGERIGLPTRGDNDAQPIVRISPKYPSRAIKEGIEGWVKLAFDINGLGEVINVKVLDAEPKRIFNKAAKRALKKWKYKAKYIDGKPQQQSNLTVQLDFNLEQQS